MTVPMIRTMKKLYGMIPYEKKLGRAFSETRRFLEAAEGWSREQREDYRLEELKRLISHAYENVPYYRRVFDERGISPREINCFNDMDKIPYLTKEIVRENRDDMIAVNYRKSALRRITTGGTTGVPLDFYDDRMISDGREWAFVTHLWKTVGYDPDRRNRSVILRGVMPASGFCEHKGLNLILSSTKMNEENMLDYLRLIEDFDPDYIQAYPSSAWVLSNFKTRNNIEIRVPSLRAVICSSEVIYDFQRSKIREAFDVPVYSFYGLSERAVIAGGCEAGHAYHVCGEYGHTEIIDAEGWRTESGGAEGEIVCTGFGNYAMPFIRYRTGDIAVIAGSECACGRDGLRLSEIRGRVQDYFVDKRGGPVSFIYHDEPLWRIKDKITAYRFVQDEPGKVRLDIEHRGAVAPGDFRDVKEAFLHWYPSMDVEISSVSSIERTGSGKFRYLIQNLPVEAYGAFTGRQ